MLERRLELSQIQSQFIENFGKCGMPALCGELFAKIDNAECVAWMCDCADGEVYEARGLFDAVPHPSAAELP